MKKATTVVMAPLSVLCKTCKFGLQFPPGNEGADDKTGTADDGQRSAGFCKP